jgi:hypothetical protein
MTCLLESSGVLLVDDWMLVSCSDKILEIFRGTISGLAGDFLTCYSF